MNWFKRSILFLICSFSLFSTAYANDPDAIQLDAIADPSSGQITIVGRRVSPGQALPYSVIFSTNGMEVQRITSNLNGSFSYTAPKRLSGQTLVVEVLRPNGTSKFTRSFQIPGTNDPSQRPPIVQNPPPYNPPPQNPPRYNPPPYNPPPVSTVDPYKLEAYAKTQARTVANRVARTYGALENYRYNFSDGFWSTFVLESAYLQQNPDYRNGYRKGQMEGGNLGLTDGRAQGTSLGVQAATTEARRRVIAVLDSGQGPSPVISSIPVSCTIGSPSMVFQTVESLLDSLNSKLEAHLRTLRFGDDEFVVTFDFNTLRWGFKDIYGYGRQNKYQFVDTWFRADFALAEWKANRLGGRYDIQKYLSFDINQQAQFERAFQDEYNRVIDDKFERVKRAPHAEASRQGIYYGQLALASAAFEQGRKAGYTNVYQATYQQGCNESLPQTYQAALPQKLADYQANAFLETSGARLLDGNGDSIFSIGEHIGVQIPSLSNLGGQPTQVNISLRGTGLQSTQSISVPMAPYSSVSVSSPQLRDLAIITDNVPLDQPVTVSLQIGARSESLSFIVRTTDAVRSFAQSGSQNLRSKILQDLRAEFDNCFQGRGRCYGESDTKLQQLVNYCRFAPSNEKARLLSLRPDISSFTASGWHPLKKRKFEKLLKDFQ